MAKKTIDRDPREGRARQRQPPLVPVEGRRPASAPPHSPARRATRPRRRPRWDLTADVVIIGAGVAGLPAAITARDLGASVIVVEENFDIGGRGMLSGGRVHLGGGHALQQKFGIKDSADQVFRRLGALRRR